MNRIKRLYLRQLFREGINTGLTAVNTLLKDGGSHSERNNGRGWRGFAEGCAG